MRSIDADRGAVHDERALLLAVFANIGEIETVRHAKVVLHGKGSVFFTVHILHLYVDFRAIKCCFVFCFFKFARRASASARAEDFALFPRGIIFVIFLGIGAVAEREAVVIILAKFEPKDAVGIYR